VFGLATALCAGRTSTTQRGSGRSARVGVCSRVRTVASHTRLFRPTAAGRETLSDKNPSATYRRSVSSMHVENRYDDAHRVPLAETLLYSQRYHIPVSLTVSPLEFDCWHFVQLQILVRCARIRASITEKAIAFDVLQTSIKSSTLAIVILSPNKLCTISHSTVVVRSLRCVVISDDNDGK
jgi:hypothetical protein